MRFRAGLSAGRGDADPRLIAGYVRAVIDAHRLRAIVCTEVYSRRTARAIRGRLPQGWRARRLGEFLLCWDSGVCRGARWPLPALHRISHVWSGRDQWRDTRRAARHLIVRATGHRLILEGSHLPASVEMGVSWRTSPWPARPQVAAHRIATAAWGRTVMRRMIRWPGATQLAFMDANTDQRRPEWRDRLTRDLRMRSIWEGRVPDRGTHAGGRLIDTGHTTARVTDAGVSHVKPPPGMDHTAIWCELHLPDH